ARMRARKASTLSQGWVPGWSMVRLMQSEWSCSSESRGGVAVPAPPVRRGKPCGAPGLQRTVPRGAAAMPRGSKDKYTDKQKRKAEHIEESYEAKGVPEDEAEARAWATVNKQSGGGERAGGSGRTKSSRAKADDRKESASRDRKSTRLNSSHVKTSYAVCCLK